MVWDYCGFVPASLAAKGVNRSRQTVHAIYTKLGQRLAYMFEENDFPNFSSSIATKTLENDEILRKILSVWITPKTYDLLLINEYDPLPEKKRNQNVVAIKRTGKGTYIIRILNHDGAPIDYNNIPDSLIPELDEEFISPSVEYSEKENIVGKIMSTLQYRRSDLKLYDEIVPKFGYDDYLDYKKRGIVADHKVPTVYQARYRVIQYMIKTDKFLKGFSRESYIYYFSRARLLELMRFMCSWAQRKYNKLTDKDAKVYARDAAYMLIMLSLRYKPL